MKTNPARCLGLIAFTLLAVTVSAGSAPAPSPAPAAPARKNVEYKLTVSDKLTVNFQQVPTLLNTTTRIDANGNIKLVWIGDVQVKGLTVNEAEKAIIKAYGPTAAGGAGMLRAPEVRILIDDYAPRVAHIPQHVQKSGSINLSPDVAMDLVDVILAAGGFIELGNGEKVTVTRKLPDGKQQTLGPFDIEGMIKNKKPRDVAPIIEPEDIINIPARLY